MDYLLIILTGSLGDICRGFSVLSPIKRRFPKCKVSWLTDQRWTGLVNEHPLIDEVIVFNRKRRLNGLVSCIRTLRERRFDCVLDLQRILKSGIFSLSTGAKRRIGFHQRDSKEFNWIFQTETIPSVGDGVSKVIHYSQFLSPLGISVNQQIDFGFPKGHFSRFTPNDFPTVADNINKDSHDSESVDRSIPVGIVMGSSWSSKDWPLQGVQRLVAGLLSTESDLTLHLLGDSSRQPMATSIKEYFFSNQNPNAEMQKVANSQRLYDWVGKTDLNQLAAIIERCAIVVGPDSGPGHLAAALGIPYLVLFGPTDPERVAPWGSKHLAIRSELGCAPCGRRECPGLDNLCMRTLSPERVLQSITQIFK